MSILFTLKELRDSARERADYEDDGGRITDTELNKYINRCISDLYDLICTPDGARIYVINAPVLAKIGDFENYAVFKLPSDFYKLRAVKYFSGGDYWEYEPIDPSDFPNWSADPPDDKCGMFTFRKNPRTGTATLTTFPNVSECNLAVLYIPDPPVLSDDNDTWDGFGGWEDYVVVKAAIKCLSKDQDDTRSLKAELKDIAEDIRLNAGDLDSGNPKKVRRERPGLASALGGGFRTYRNYRSR